ncbi:hypothetical protein AURDEDRAFT_109922 [Auricularia subglabra TFB-10046 SS5]|nr:hypothetical protein AURDEDRAFT_109922 [Auricularia subglabra TFB-10046 SS5]
MGALHALRDGIDLWLASLPKYSLAFVPPAGAQLPVVLAASDFPSLGHGAFALLLTGPYTLRVSNGPLANAVTQLDIDPEGYNHGAFGRGVVIEALRMLVRVGSPSGQMLVRPNFVANPILAGSVREIVLLYKSVSASKTQERVSHIMHASTFPVREGWRH